MDFGDFTSAPPAPPAPAVVELDRKLYTMLEIEAKRYRNFFATLDEHHTGQLSRDVALAFYAKSSLSEQVRFAHVRTIDVLCEACDVCKWPLPSAAAAHTCYLSLVTACRRSRRCTR